MPVFVPPTATRGPAISCTPSVASEWEATVWLWAWWSSAPTPVSSEWARVLCDVRVWLWAWWASGK